jgi:hypothetical protein
MKALKEYMNEGLLAGQDSTIKGGANIAKNVMYDEACKVIEQFINDNYRLSYDRSFKTGKITIRKRPNKDGRYIVDCKTACDVSLCAWANSMTNDIFVWGKVRNFYICDNDNITSLKGCPEEVENFSIMRVHNLKSFEGMPKVTRYFNFGFNGIKTNEAELKKISGASNITVWDK